MNTLSPRSSFHHAVVTPSVRRSSSRAKAMAPWRTSVKVQDGSRRTYTWMPRLPLVLGNARMPSSSNSSRATPATRTASANPAEPNGSRSIRSSSGRSLSSRRVGHGWNVIAPMCAAHAATAISVMQISSATPARREQDASALDVVGRAPHHPLLVERVAVAVGAGRHHHSLAYALGPALEGDRTVPQCPHQPVLDGDVVLGDHQLGDLGGEVGRLVDHPVRARDPDRTPAGLDLHRVARHVRPSARQIGADRASASAVGGGPVGMYDGPAAGRARPGRARPDRC